LFTVVTPGGFEQNFIDIAALDAVTSDAVDAIEARLGLTIR